VRCRSRCSRAGALSFAARARRSIEAGGRAVRRPVDLAAPITRALLFDAVATGLLPADHSCRRCVSDSAWRAVSRRDASPDRRSLVGGSGLREALGRRGRAVILVWAAPSNRAFASAGAAHGRLADAGDRGLGAPGRSNRPGRRVTGQNRMVQTLGPCRRKTAPRLARSGPTRAPRVRACTGAPGGAALGPPGADGASIPPPKCSRHWRISWMQGYRDAYTSLRRAVIGGTGARAGGDRGRVEATSRCLL